MTDVACVVQTKNSFKKNKKAKPSSGSYVRIKRVKPVKLPFVFALSENLMLRCDIPIEASRSDNPRRLHHAGHVRPVRRRL